MSATWMKDLEAAVVTKLNADAALTGICGLIEAGLMLPMKAQEINQGERPYLGVKAVGYSKHLGAVPGSAVGFSIHDVSLRIDVQHADGQQKACEQRVKDILAQLALTVGRERVSNPFALVTDTVQTTDLDPGSGLVSMVEAPTDESDMWVVEGEYTFTTRIRLRLIA